MCNFYSISWHYVSLNISQETLKVYIVRGPVQPIHVKAALALALNDKEMQWLTLGSSTIDNHNATSSGITSAAQRAGESIAGPSLPAELRST